jgi:hypothetical protein
MSMTSKTTLVVGAVAVVVIVIIIILVFALSSAPVVTATVHARQVCWPGSSITDDELGCVAILPEYRPAEYGESYSTVQEGIVACENTPNCVGLDQSLNESVRIVTDTKLYGGTRIFKRDSMEEIVPDIDYGCSLRGVQHPTERYCRLLYPKFGTGAGLDTTETSIENQWAVCLADTNCRGVGAINRQSDGVDHVMYMGTPNKLKMLSFYERGS